MDRKYKTVDSIKGFEIHNLRKKEVPNADPSKTHLNRVLIGSENIVQDVKEYVYGIKIRSNANIAIDMVFTVNHKFFENLPPQDLEKWIDWNMKFFKDNFGDNVISCVLHQDESAPHFHLLLCPRFWNEDKNRYELSSNKYFGSKIQLREWQTKYANHMHSKFNNLIRGIKGSKARHMDIKEYYALINKKLEEKDNSSILAHAKQSYLLEKRVRALQNTIMQLQEDERFKKLLDRTEKAEKKTKEYRDIAKEMKKQFNISNKDVDEIIDKVQEKNNKGRER
ncbi:MAG: plasmid recombination protein [Bacillota bacterium]|nr:plasmid recombination protein [Bacillota bacterium]